MEIKDATEKAGRIRQLSNFTYEKKGVATYLVYTIDDSEEVDTKTKAENT